MPYSITTKDGITINNIPDDVDPQSPQLKSRVQELRAGKAAQSRTVPQELARQVGLTARAGVEGLAGLAGIVTDPVAALANQVLPDDMQMQPLQQATSGLLTQAGMPVPETQTERIVQQAAQSMVGAAGGVGLAGKVAQAATSPVTRAVAQQMAAGPAAQIAGGAGSGAAAQLAAEEGAGPAGQIAASLAGGVAGSAAGARLSTPRAAAPQKIPQAVQESDQAGVRLMTSDVAPPNTFAAKWLQQAGERIPVAGTGPVRAAQQTERVEAVRNVLRDFGADQAAAASDDVMRDLAATRSKDLTKYTKMKTSVIDGLSDKGAVDVTRTVAAIDGQIAKLGELRTAEVNPIVSRLEDWKQAIQGQNIQNVETLRKQIGESFKAPELSAVRGTGEKALSSIYGPLKQDMGDFIKASGARQDFNKWSVANSRLAQMAGELKGGALKSVLRRGDATPEAVNQMLFSQKPSEVRTLYAGLSPQGRANARTAIMAKAAQDAGGIDNVSPEKFATSVKKLGGSIGVFFDDADVQRIDGLVRTLNLTRRAGDAAVAPPTGVQTALPVGAAVLADIMGGAGAAIASAASIGGAARIYESPRVRNMLLKMAQTPRGSAEEAAMASRIISAMQAAQSNQSDAERENQGF